MKLTKVLPIILITSLLIACVNTNTIKDTSNSTFNLECLNIPNSIEKICIIKTLSQYGPFHDVIFYRQNAEGHITYIKTETGNVATFGGIEFSVGGKYMVEYWAEEGHPTLTFYRTKYFLSADFGEGKGIIEIINDYYFDRIKSFTDDGKVIYSVFSGENKVIKHFFLVH